MQPENHLAEGPLAPLNKVTPVSKYLALTLFIILPFIGGWIGYTYAPEKVVERDVYRDSVVQVDIAKSTSADAIDRVNLDDKFQKKQFAKTYTEEVFLTEDDVELDFIILSDACQQYRRGAECTITVLSNNTFGLLPGRLEQKTGPFEWGVSDTLAELRVMEDGKLFLVWGSGDGGGSAREFSVWDTKSGKHTYISGYVGMHGESMTVRISLADEKKYEVLTFGEYPTIPEGAVLMFDRNMFAELSTDIATTSPKCIAVKPIPKDRTNPAAPWLLEYTYGCGSIGENSLFRYYELDPVTDEVRPL